MHDVSRFYTVKEVAEIIGKTPMTVYRMIREGKIPTFDTIGTGEKAPRPTLIPKKRFQELYPQYFNERSA